MKVVILAGGRGSRIQSGSNNVPKALVEIGGKPILWHLMQQYKHAGYKEFLIATGFLSDQVQSWVDACDEDWSAKVIDTGVDESKCSRIEQLQPYIGDATFMMTWCDGLSDIDLPALLDFHKAHGKMVTLTAVHPPLQYGHLQLKEEAVLAVNEKPVLKTEWINGAFFVLEPEIFEYLKAPNLNWEKEVLPALAAKGELCAYRHEGFWQSMDTLREKELLEAQLIGGRAPWQTWNKSESFTNGQ